MSWIDESVERTGALEVLNRAAHADPRRHRVLQGITARLGQTVVYQAAPRPDATLGSDNLNGDGEYSVTINPRTIRMTDRAWMRLTAGSRKESGCDTA